MTNKLYELSKQEAIEQLMNLLDKGEGEICRFHEPELSQLTAELYGMKLLDMSQPYKVLGFMRIDGCWFADYKEEPIGTTQQLHDHLVREFNKEEGR